jgi:hypothetical protein
MPTKSKLYLDVMEMVATDRNSTQNSAALVHTNGYKLASPMTVDGRVIVLNQNDPLSARGFSVTLISIFILIMKMSLDQTIIRNGNVTEKNRAV